jgi:hypothetical protein
MVKQWTQAVANVALGASALISRNCTNRRSERITLAVGAAALGAEH